MGQVDVVGIGVYLEWIGVFGWFGIGPFAKAYPRSIVDPRTMKIVKAIAGAPPEPNDPACLPNCGQTGGCYGPELCSFWTEYEALIAGTFQGP